MNSSPSDQRYISLDHTGDIRLKIFGKSLPDLFVNAAYALFDTITEANRIDAQLSDEIIVSGIDREELLVNWLSELNYLFVTEGKVFNRFEIDRFKDTELHGMAIGEKFNSHKHPLRAEVKAVTFHDLMIQKVGDHWETNVVFDI
ncbi:MAG: archease [candidate division KSB1 bacterium]|nr:archease [candidate division KSB1 bacterium]MDZ7333673.1 archease [candidate division KSB1 bacterium]MDZ7356121.1 archease [candidate division KSB1 bacterium]MDZ7375540.1 archease [candidate division KSB1 bacterium]MDZ7398902.1 archease [candidate division KSB1 bacterium]